MYKSSSQNSINQRKSRNKLQPHDEGLNQFQSQKSIHNPSSCKINFNKFKTIQQ